MSFQSRWPRRVAILLCAASLVFLYLFGLNRTGLLGPDEPRYAAIGRAMAATGDWITPHLWGKPWFEKPPLLYWMTALGFTAGLDADLAPRLPIALLSVAFLIYFFLLLRREFGEQAAFYSTAILATSAGWLAYSHVAVTDLPLSATFAAAMLIVLRGNLGRAESAQTGVLLGLAILAKGLVPVALFIPAVWFLRRRFTQLLSIFAVAAVVAGPWYILATVRNGMPFLEELFWKQHFGRFASSTLAHQQPFWFYLPVLLALIFPWTPVVALLFQKRTQQDSRVTFLLAWLLWGLVFFSIFLHKLPGYLLPLLPAAAALLGIAIHSASRRSVTIVLTVSAALLGFVPAIQHLLPDAIATGISHVPIQPRLLWLAPVLAAAVAAIWLERAVGRIAVVGFVALGITLLVVRIVWETFPVIDQVYSARPAWIFHSESITCIPKSDRALRYGLDYYLSRELPDCN